MSNPGCEPVAASACIDELRAWCTVCLGLDFKVVRVLGANSSTPFSRLGISMTGDSGGTSEKVIRLLLPPGRGGSSGCLFSSDGPWAMLSATLNASGAKLSAKRTSISSTRPVIACGHGSILRGAQGAGVCSYGVVACDLLGSICDSVVSCV